MTHKDDGGGVYTPHRTASQGPSAANAALTNQQIEAIFRPNGKSAPIDDYIGQLNKLAQNWHDNTSVLQQTVSDPSHPTSMAGLINANTGDLKWTGTAASDYGTKAKATAAYSDQIAGVMPKINSVLSQLATNLGTSKKNFEPIFEAWGTPNSGSPAKVPHAMADLIVNHLWHTVIDYSVGPSPDTKYYSDTSGPMTINATTYVPQVNMHADPSNPYLATTFTLYAKDDGGGDYGYSGLVWCSYNRQGGVSIEKVTVYDSADGNNSMDGTSGFDFTPEVFQQRFYQQYTLHLQDLMTNTGQHFATAQSQFPALPQPAAALKPPTSDGTGPTGMSPTGGSPTGGSPAGLNPGKIGSPGAPGLKQPAMPKAPSGLPTPKPPPYHLPTPNPPATGLPGPGHGGLPGGNGGLPGGNTGLPNPGGSNSGFPTPTGLPPIGGGTSGYTSTQTAGFDPNQLPKLGSGLPTGGLNGLGGLGGGSAATGLTGGPGGLGGLGGLGAGGLGASGAFGGFGGGAPNAGTPALGTTASGAPLAAGETAAQGALGEQAAMAEAGTAGRMPMMPPMAPMGMNGGNGDRNRKSWLPEEEDLWGLAESSAAPPVIGSES